MLDQRHPGAVAPLEANVWSVAAWALPVAGGRRGLAAGSAVAVGSILSVVPALRGRVDDPVLEAGRLGGMGALWVGRGLATATTRSWLPIALLGALRSRRIRHAVIAAAVVPAVVDWVSERPDLDPVRWTAVRTFDDVSYCVGVWIGCWQARSWRALRPHAVGPPGVGVSPVTFGPEDDHCGTRALLRSGSSTRGCSSMVEPQPSKLVMRVRFPSPAPEPHPRAPSPGTDIT